MAAAALRELRLQSLKRACASAECLGFESDQETALHWKVYRLDAAELCSALQNAAKRRVNNREVRSALDLGVCHDTSCVCQVSMDLRRGLPRGFCAWRALVKLFPKLAQPKCR